MSPNASHDSAGRPELPLVSIVTPSLNQKAFLAAAIESVLRQDYPKLEYIVVDGGSTDGSLGILRSYGERVRWVSEPDSGQSQAINKGFRMCSGEVVAWINADDVLLSGAVGKAAAAFLADPGVGMVYGEGYLIDEQGVIKRRFPYTEPFNLWRLVNYGDTILQQTVFMRRSALEAIGYLDETLHWGLDWDLFIRLGKRYRVKYLAEDLGCLREYGMTKTSTGGYRRLRELARLIRRHAGRRITPSFLAYAQDFGSSQLPELARGRWPGALGRLAARVVRGLSGVTQTHVWRYMEQSQGWYPDGAAGPVAHFLLPNLGAEAQLVIRGRLPQFSPEMPGQTLRVMLNGRLLRETPLASGPFELAEPVPQWALPAEVLRVDLEAGTCLTSRFYTVWGRELPVCYFLEGVEVRLPADGVK